MTINLCNTTSPQRKIYKELTEGITKTITFRDSENVCNPVVLLTYSAGIDRYNYAYIPQLHRYYWIMGIEELIGGMCALTLKVDVLMTYKPEIMDTNLMLKRKGIDGIGMIPDEQLPLYPYKDLKVIKFEGQPFIDDSLTEHSPCFLLTVGGR